jgi:exonuclease VII small subunit
MTPPSEQRTFAQVVGRLDSIVEEVRRKDTALDASLDMLDEAIELGLAAVDLVDAAEPGPDAEAAPAPTEDPRPAAGR